MDILVVDRSVSVTSIRMFSLTVEIYVLTRILIALKQVLIPIDIHDISYLIFEKDIVHLDG